MRAKSVMEPFLSFDETSSQTIEDPSSPSPQTSAMMNRRGKGYSVQFPELPG